METQLIKAIKTDEQYKVILQQIKALWSCPENSSEADLLEVLSILADDYENKHYPIGPPDPIEAVKYEMEENGLTTNDLIPYFGSRSRVSEILNRKRPLTFTMAKKLFRGLNIPAETFLSFLVYLSNLIQVVSPRFLDATPAITKAVPLNDNAEKALIK